MSSRIGLDPTSIRSTCLELAPILWEQIEYEGEESFSTWMGDGSNGKALEVLALAWLARTAQELGLSLTIPPALTTRPDFFYARNVLPHSNASRAGHSDGSQHSTIEDLFLAALTPRIEIREGSRVWSIFREGLPPQEVLDFLNALQPSGSRPDLLIVEGEFKSHVTGQLVTSCVSQTDFDWLFTLRAIDGSRPQVVDFENLLPRDISSCGLVEVSLLKSTELVDRQLDRYSSEYGVELSHTLFFHGGSSHSAVAGLEVAATSIMNRTANYAKVARESMKWLVKSLKL